MGIRKRDAQAGAGVWTVGSVLWGAYSSFTTARDLAADAAGFRKVLADPPFELPWILAGLGAIALVAIWRFWVSDESRDETDAPGMSAATKGPESPIFQQTHSGTGHNIAAHRIQFGARLLNMDDATMRTVTDALDPDRPVSFMWAAYGRTERLKAELENYLRASGFTISGCYVEFQEGYAPRLERPLMIGRDGLQARKGSITFLQGQQVVAIDGDILIDD